ncbi:MAG TPA: FAD-dependent oxidoreductase [Saprospiraceae bacterium]|nr:FAD-dependent oxidoreductase [Saprospiraceae bacterium]
MHIAIIGNGIAGVTAARFIRKLSDHKITLISAETEYFFSRTALMYIYMGHMRFEDTKPYEDWFWSKNRIELKNGYVSHVDVKEKTLHFQNGEKMVFDKLLIASGSKSNKFGWPGQDLKGVQGLYSFQDLETMEQASKNLKRAVIVGGGLIGIEMAEMFHSRHIPVTFLVREKNYWDNILPVEESKMVARHILENGIDLRLETELKEILDDGNGQVRGVVTKNGERIDCQFVGLTAGVNPNVDFLKGSDIEVKKGVLVNDFLQINHPDIYAAGDCAELLNPQTGRRAIEAIWYVGRMMGETAAYNICGKPIKYDPGIWFNSAKFFDIEYQVYGTVPAEPPAHHASVFWEHRDGRKSIRIVYDKNTENVVGFNLMGIRYRQEVCEKWIREKTPVETVLANLSLANFDSEFFREYEQEVLAVYKNQTGKTIFSKKKRRLDDVVAFLKNQVKI